MRDLKGMNIPLVYKTNDFYENTFLVQFDKILLPKTGAIIQAYGVEWPIVKKISKVNLTSTNAQAPAEGAKKFFPQIDSKKFLP